MRPVVTRYNQTFVRHFLLRMVSSKEMVSRYDFPTLLQATPLVNFRKVSRDWNWMRRINFWFMLTLLTLGRKISTVMKGIDALLGGWSTSKCRENLIHVHVPSSPYNDTS